MDPAAQIPTVVTFKDDCGRRKLVREKSGEPAIFDTPHKADRWLKARYWQFRGAEAKAVPYDPKRHK